MSKVHTFRVWSPAVERWVSFDSRTTTEHGLLRAATRAKLQRGDSSSTKRQDILVKLLDLEFSMQHNFNRYRWCQLDNDTVSEMILYNS